MKKNCHNSIAKIVFRLMKEDYDAKLQAAIKSEGIYKNKLLLLEERLKCTDIQFEKTENRLKECILNLNNMNEVNFMKITNWLGLITIAIFTIC